MTTDVDLVTAVVAALNAADPPLVPSGRIFSPRDWPTYEDLYPVIVVGLPSEQKESLGRNVPQFNTTVVVPIMARLKTTAAPADAGAMSAQAAIMALKRNIEVTLINDFALTALIQQFTRVVARLTVDAQSEYHIGEMLAEYHLETYQGPEEFAPPALIPLQQVTLTVVEPDGITETKLDFPDLQS